MDFLKEHAQFFTATIYEWKPLLKQAKYKDIIINSLNFLVQKKRVYVYAFVLMDNHIHLIWQVRNEHKLKDVQRDFLKFTAQTFRFDLLDNQPEMLKQFQVDALDRKYQFWRRNSLSVDVYSPSIFEQKLDYIHDNPVRAGICDYPTDYYYSSAKFYEEGDETFSFLSHHEGGE